MNRSRDSRLTTIVLVTGSLAVLLASIVATIGLGPLAIRPALVYGLIVEYLLPEGSAWTVDASYAQRETVLGIRLPRVLLGVVVGGGLAACGCVLQALLRNPLADPYLLGVSSGASFGVVLALALPFALKAALGLSAFAFAFGMAAFVLVIGAAAKRMQITPLRLVLSGVAVGALFTAMSQWLILSFPDNGDLRRALTWILGSLTGQPLSAVVVPAIVTGATTLIFWALSGRLDALALGEEAARTLGVDVTRLRAALLVLVALTIGCLVAVSGAIGFVALVVPHALRLMTGTAHRRLLPLSALWGATFLVWADVLARVARPGQEAPLGAVTALLGPPVFLLILRRST